MEILIEVRRQHSPADAPYYQTIKYQAANDEENVATVLRNLNATPELRDTEGREVGEIHWQCSCLQKKCGACAMLINGLPRLACDTKLKDCRENRLLRLEPLKKFPIVRDLMVDRSSMMKNLRSSPKRWRSWRMTRHAACNAAVVSRSARTLRPAENFMVRLPLCPRPACCPSCQRRGSISLSNATKSGFTAAAANRLPATISAPSESTSKASWSIPMLSRCGADFSAVIKRQTPDVRSGVLLVVIITS